MHIINAFTKTDGILLDNSFRSLMKENLSKTVAMAMGVMYGQMGRPTLGLSTLTRRKAMVASSSQMAKNIRQIFCYCRSTISI